MFNPCFEHCNLRFGKQYTPDCDDKCEFAKVVKEKKDLEKELLIHKLALFKMIHQFMYSVTDKDGVEYFDDYCESAGEAAFSALDFEDDRITKEEFFRRYDECRTKICELNGVENDISFLEYYKENGDL